MYSIRKIVILLILVVLTFASCNIKKEQNYHVKVEYCGDFNKEEVVDRRNGFVVFDFLGFFKNDSLTIKVNNRRFIREVLNTNEITGNALLVEIDSLKNVKEISLRINNTKETTVRCDPDNQLFVVTQKNDTLFIKGVTAFKAKE